MKKSRISRISSLVRIAKRKMEAGELVLTGKQNSFLYKIITNPKDLSETATKFLEQIESGFYNQNDKGFF